MNNILRTLVLLANAACVTATLTGCASFMKSQRPAPAPEPVGNYVVLVYELPFVYDEDQSRQEAFLSMIRKVIAPADWERGPHSMTAIANMLVVSTTPDNHMRLERFFDSIPELPEKDSGAWRAAPRELEDVPPPHTEESK